MFEKQSGKGHKISNSITEENGSTIKGLYKDFEIEFETYIKSKQISMFTKVVTSKNSNWPQKRSVYPIS